MTAAILYALFSQVEAAAAFTAAKFGSAEPILQVLLLRRNLARQSRGCCGFYCGKILLGRAEVARLVDKHRPAVATVVLK